MFEKFSDEAIKVIMHAQEEARILKHKHVGSEHLLLGVFASGANCIPPRYTNMFGVNLTSLRKAVETIHEAGSEPSPEELPLNDDARSVFLRAYENSQHQVIEPNHILLGLLNFPDFENTMVMRIFSELRIEINDARLPIIYQTCFKTYLRVSDGSEMSQSEADELCKNLSKVIEIAIEESRRLDQNFIGTEMLLLGLLGAGGAPARLLEALGLKLNEARAHVEKLIGSGAGIISVELPFTPRAKKLLKIAQEEANKMGAEPMDSRHLLLAFTHEQDGVAWQVLREKGVDLSALRESVLALFEETR